MENKDLLSGFPRMRGDEPDAHSSSVHAVVFSPHARG